MQNRKGIQLQGALPPDPHSAVFGQFVCYFSLTVISIYWSMNATVIWCMYMVSNCCLSLYLNVRRGPGKMLPKSWKSLGNVYNQESGNPSSMCVFCVLLSTAYEYSPSDGTDGTLDDADASQPSMYVANKLRKKRIIRASRKLAAWNNAAVPRNLSADAVRVLSFWTPLVTWYL